jgi:MGT family glycosyltransferase
VSRFLFVVPPLVGHVNPTVSVARELTARGHDVAWVGHPRTVRPLLPAGATLLSLDDDVPQDLADQVSARACGVRGAERLKFLWEEFFVPLTRAMRPGVDAAVDAFAPDALVVDQQTLAGSIVARKRALPWATFATTSAGVIDPLSGLPKVRRWLDGLIAGLQREAGLDAIPDAERSPHLFVAFTTRALLGADAGEFPAHYHFVGPSISDRPETAEFPWDRLNGMPRVLVSLGTVNADAGDRFYRETVEALGGHQVQVVLVAPRDRVGPAPDNVIVRDFVPQLALLPHMDAVVCHAGHNTVVESLAHGRPLVLAPIKDDQPIVAQQVVDAGAGIRVKFGRVKAGELRAAVHSVLHDPAFADSAARVSESFAGAGGAPRAAELLEELA